MMVLQMLPKHDQAPPPFEGRVTAARVFGHHRLQVLGFGGTVGALGGGSPIIG
jgi:hypothetical protein